MEDNTDAEGYGVLALVLGDFHIPHRTSEIPPKYKEILSPNQFAYVLCTGNLGNRETQDWIKTLAPSIHIVKGDFEQDTLEFPEEKVVEIKGTKIGLVHGHQVIPWGDEEALYNKARELDVDLIISGHTHEMKFSQLGKTYFINPGSMTGAFSPLKADVPPSFLILEFKSNATVIYSYSLVDNEIKTNDCTITHT